VAGLSHILVLTDSYCHGNEGSLLSGKIFVTPPDDALKKFRPITSNEDIRRTEFCSGSKEKSDYNELKKVSLTEPQKTDVYFSVVENSFFGVLSLGYPEFPRQVAVLWTLNKISRGDCLRSKALARNFFSNCLDS
jgi:hypothetical protein